MKIRKKRSRQENIYQLALAGISAALALLLVWLSVVVRFTTIAFYIAAGCALMVPLTRRYYVASIFAYVVSGVLGFVIAGDIFIVAGYVAYFGPISIITAIMYEHKLKPYISIPVKVAYINAALAFLYFVCGTIMIDSSLIGEIPYWAVALVGTAALLLIDFAMQYIFRCLKPLVGKVLRVKDAPPPAQEAVNADDDDDEESPFEEL